MFIILRLCLQLIFKINGNAFLYNKTVLLEYNKKTIRNFTTCRFFNTKSYTIGQTGNFNKMKFPARGKIK